VCAFAEPDADAFGEQFLDVGLGSAHIGLDHRPYAVFVARNAVELVDEVERALGVGRAFHINANKIPGRHAGRLGDQAADDFVGHVLVHIQAHVGQFEADVRVQFIGGNFVEQVVVELSAGAGFVSVGDVLAQIVDGDAGADLIHGGGGANCVLNLGAGDEAGGSALAKAGALGDGAHAPALGQCNEHCPQHGAPDFRGFGLPEACVGITLFFTTNAGGLQCAANVSSRQPSVIIMQILVD